MENIAALYQGCFGLVSGKCPKWNRTRGSQDFHSLEDDTTRAKHIMAITPFFCYSVNVSPPIIFILFYF